MTESLFDILDRRGDLALADRLDRAAAHIKAHGLGHGKYGEPGKRMCIEGTINWVCDSGSNPARYTELSRRAINLVQAHLGLATSSLVLWNDGGWGTPMHSAWDAIEALQGTARTLRERWAS